MSQTFIKTIFANTGDISTIPAAAQPDGSESFEKGFPINYQEDPDTDPTAQLIDRQQFNYLMQLITANIQVLQVHGAPDFITSAANGGSPYSYDINSLVRFTGGWADVGAAVYISLIDANTTDPTNQTNWGLISSGKKDFAGTVKVVSDFTTLPTGYLWANGQTIGSASSNATGRANVDTQALFNIYWAYSNANLPIYTSTGALSTRGISAAADWAANKAVSIPNLMGRVVAGLDGMGGAAATNLLTIGGSNISGTAAGAAGGAQNVSLTAAQNGTHTHGVGIPQGTVAPSSPPTYTSGDDYTNNIFNTVNVTSGPSGSGDAHLNVQPTVVLPIIIALGTA